MNIEFIRGHRACTAYHDGPMDAESVPIVPILIDINALGFITVHSKPGSRVGKYMQRAYLTGYIKKLQAADFVDHMKRAMVDEVYIQVPRNLSADERSALIASDVYWIERTHDSHNIGSHILTKSDVSFEPCYYIFNELYDNYVCVELLDLVAGRQGVLFEHVLAALAVLGRAP